MKNKKIVFGCIAAVILISILIKNPYFDPTHDDKVVTEKTVEKARAASVKLRKAYKDNSIYLNGIKEPYDKARTEYAHATTMVADLEKGKRKKQLTRQLKSVEQEIEIAHNFNKAVRAGKIILTAQQKAEKKHLKEPLDVKAAVKSQTQLEETLNQQSGVFSDIPFSYVQRDMKKTYLYPAQQFNEDSVTFIEAIALLDEAKQAKENGLEGEKKKYIEEVSSKAATIKTKDLKEKLENKIKNL